MRCFALLLAILVFGCGLAAPAQADKRVALVIGNSAYVSAGRLENPVNDARLLAETLRGVGFTLVGDGAQLDLDRNAFAAAIQRFGQQLQGADVGLFYYAGHGVQVRGTNYLVPISANLTREADVDFQVVDVNLVLRQMGGAGTKLNIVILDACRTNPFSGRGLRSGGGGLAQMQAPEGTLISYATAPDTVAQDGAGANSPFSRALAQIIREPGLGIFDAFNEVGLAVQHATGGVQQPWVSSSPITGRFQFAAAPVSPSASDNEAGLAWSEIRNTTNPALVEAFAKRFGTSFYAELARARLADLNAAPSNPPPGTPPKAAHLLNPSSGDWSGTGAKSSASFGGPPFCQYSVAMQDLKLDASVDENGNVTSARLTGTMVETTIGQCPFAPLGSKRHNYTGGGSIDGDVIILELSADPGNSPRASATFRGRIVKGRLNGTLTLHRLDTANNLDWTVRSLVQ